jgi:murein DD-endopeptidase MepM/ murein hydrolase activator NlpD
MDLGAGEDSDLYAQLAQDDVRVGGEIEDVRRWADRVEESLDGVLAVLDITQSKLSSQAESTEYLRTRWIAMPTDWPLEGTLTSGYGYRRSPFDGGLKRHTGLDLSAPIGRQIRAPAPGIVTSAGWNEGYGRMVMIDHGYGVMSRYAHMGVVLVKAGEEIKKGQALGGVGMTGRTTGPHLHYEIQVDGNFVDPMVFLR